MFRRMSGLSALALFCTLYLAVGCLATDPPVKTSENRDTLLYIRTDPPGAKVLLDGKELGTSDGLFRVEPGVGTILVELDGHKADAKQVTIRANRVTRIELALKPKIEAGEQRSGKVKWGPIKEEVLTGKKKRVAELLNLDTGQRAVMSGFGADDRQTHRWIRDRGVDLLGVVLKGMPMPGLLFFDVVVKEIPETQFEKVTPADVAGDWHLNQGEPDKIMPFPADGKANGRPTCLFRTRENGMGVLQLIGVGEIPKSVRIRYKLVQGEARAAEAMQPAKRVHLPDADTKDAEIVLDLASGRTLKSPGGPEPHLAFTGLVKGDLAFDRVLVCLRGGKARQWDGKQFVDLPAKDRKGDTTAYELPSVPFRLLITTAEKKQFDVTILSVTEGGGINLEYRVADPALVVPLKKLV